MSRGAAAQTDRSPLCLTGGISCRPWEGSVWSLTLMLISILTSSCVFSSFYLCPSLYSGPCLSPSLFPALYFAHDLCGGLDPDLGLYRGLCLCLCPILWRLCWRMRTGPPCCDRRLGSLRGAFYPEDTPVVQRTLWEAVGQTEQKGLLASRGRRADWSVLLITDLEIKTKHCIISI